MQAAPSIQKLLDELERLPGVGPKSAQRMAYWILNTDAAEALRLADAIREVKAGVHFCARCFNYAEGDLCEICASSKRDGAVTLSDLRGLGWSTADVVTFIGSSLGVPGARCASDIADALGIEGLRALPTEPWVVTPPSS